MNVLIKPDEQNKACFGSAMAENRDLAREDKACLKSSERERFLQKGRIKFNPDGVTDHSVALSELI